MTLLDRPNRTHSKNTDNRNTFANDILEYALNSSLIGYWSWDLKKDHLSRTSRVDEIFATNASKMNNNISDFQSRFHPDDNSNIIQDIKNSLNQKKTFSQEYRLRRDDGEYIWVSFRAEKIGNDGENSSRIAGSIFDCTRQVELRELQKRREDELHLIFDNVPAKIWYKDAHNKILRLNKRAADSMNMPIEEVEGASTYDLFPEMAEKYHKDDLAVINSGEPMLGIIEEYTPKDGQSGWVQTDKIPYTDPLTGESFLFVASMDVTKQIEADQKIRENESRLNSIIETSYDGIWDWYIKDDYEYMSPRFWEMFGIDPATKTHHPSEWQDIIFPDDLEVALQNFDKHVKTKGKHPYSQEVRYKHADGSTVTVFCRGRVIEWDENGEAIRMIGTHTDITQLKKTDAELESYTRKLEQANKELDHFAYVASHDLKAPLRGIDNIASWIEEDLEDNLTPDIKSKLDLMRGRIYRLETLLKDILAFSRAGRQLSEAELLDTSGLIDEVIGWIDIPESFTIKKLTNFPEVNSVRTVLEHIFLNLISNAIKHHDRDEGEITLRYEELENAHSFSVKDDGPGIPPEYHAQVFQIFKKLQSRDEVEGSGIGLSIVKKMVESVGGSIIIDSTSEKRGTTFRFSIPK